jgi:hypothetical protein
VRLLLSSHLPHRCDPLFRPRAIGIGAIGLCGILGEHQSLDRLASLLRLDDRAQRLVHDDGTRQRLAGIVLLTLLSVGAIVRRLTGQAC